ncbi:MAG: 4Fe-4S binding protein, partial [Actinobacteria bacterium]|nr:4Fe-4S binding protein [Actinomycetota bacterium]
LNAIPTIPCTTCNYCKKGCPQDIDIPQLIRIYNSYLVFNSVPLCQHDYSWVTGKTGKASSCIECGQCEIVCPQHIEIIDVMRKMTALFD